MTTLSVKPINQTKVRATNKPGSRVGKQRYQLYANAYRQMKKAEKDGYYIECVAICESIIADRLESRRACLSPNEPKKHMFWTIRKLTKNLRKEGTSDDVEIRLLYDEIDKWSTRRNDAIHQVVKLGSEKYNDTWRSRYRAIRKTVDQGKIIAREISDKVKSLNRKDRSAKGLDRASASAPAAVQPG